ncbi:MAG: hypothetical protein ABIK09_16310 [Pseudomonadota bacterium]
MRKQLHPAFPVALNSLFLGSVFLFCGLARAGEAPAGFLGVPWEVSAPQIVETMNERGYRQLTGAAPGSLEFKGAFDGVPCQLHFGFLGGSFYSASANFCARADHPAAPLATYRQIVENLSQKYGPPAVRRSETLKTNDGKEHPQEAVAWDLVDSKTSDKYSIRVQFTVTWFADDTGDQYVVNISYNADSLGERLKKKEY